jgi:hypothetical protein
MRCAVGRAAFGSHVASLQLLVTSGAGPAKSIARAIGVGENPFRKTGAGTAIAFRSAVHPALREYSPS